MRRRTLVWGLIILIIIGGIAAYLWLRPQTPSVAPGSNGTTLPTPTDTTDTTNPELSVASLADNPTFGCTITATPDVSDNKSVERVEYYLDGTQLYVTYAKPFTLEASLSSVADGTHSLQVIAYDNSGNKTQQTYSVIVQKDSSCVSTSPAPAPSTASSGSAKKTAKTSSTSNTSSGGNSGGGTSGGGGGTTPPDTQAPTAPSNLTVSFDSSGHFNELEWTASTDNVGVDHYVVLRDGTQIATAGPARYFDMRISDGQTYAYTVRAVDAVGNTSGDSNQASIQLAPQGIWAGATPDGLDSSATGVEIGLQFSTRVTGVATGVQFHKGAGNTGVHTGTLWTTGGSQIATVTFSNETSSGWQTAYFSTPVRLTVGTHYVVSAFLPNGHTSYTTGWAGDGHVTSSLVVSALQSTFRTGAGFPNQAGFGTIGYSVDIAFAPDAPAPQTLDGSLISSKYAQWSHGPSSSQSVFPTAIWEQYAGRMENGVANGVTYQQIGIQTDVNVPFDDNLQTQSIADTNWKMFSTTTSHADRSVLDGITWAQTNPLGAYSTGYWLDDEPDMNQVNYSPGNQLEPLAEEAYGNQVRAGDSTRPAYINFGKGLAIDYWGGYSRVETGTIDTDAQHYCNAGDIVSADYYGWTDPNEPTSYHGAWTYGKVIDNMHKHCGNDKLIWGFAETGAPFSSQGNAPEIQPTPDNVEAAVWSMVVHGANGIQYFAQQFNGSFVEDTLVLDPVMKARVQSINAKLQTYAPVLNNQTDLYGVAAVSSVSGVPVDTLMKHSGGSTYVFAQAGGSQTQNNSASTSGIIVVNTTATSAQVLGESRTVPIVNGRIVDNFSAYQVHIYQF